MIRLVKRLFVVLSIILLTACVAHPYGGVYYGGRAAPTYYGGSGYNPSYYRGRSDHHDHGWHHGHGRGNYGGYGNYRGYGGYGNNYGGRGWGGRH